MKPFGLLSCFTGSDPTDQVLELNRLRFCFWFIFQSLVLVQLLRFLAFR